MRMLPDRVKLVEVSPRDGLQNEVTLVPPRIKIEMVNRLVAAGFAHIEVTSFVSPRWVPQLADANEVMAGITRPAGVTYSALTPNLQGFEAALAAKANQVVIFGAASEAFSLRNINCSMVESIERFRPVAQAALQAGIALRGSVSCAWGCPYQGQVPIERVLEAVQRFEALGCQEISIADTIGVATPEHVKAVFEAVGRVYPLTGVAGHFHDTYGQALANIYAALQSGVAIFDSSIAGLGGCPYARGATGNVASEDVLYLLQGLHIETGIALLPVVETGQWISALLGRPNMSRAGLALSAKSVSNA